MHQADFFQRVLVKMAARNDYRMIDRARRIERKAEWVEQRQLQRSECKLTHLFFFGCIMNKFHEKWERDEVARSMLFAQPAKAALALLGASVLRRAGSKKKGEGAASI